MLQIARHILILAILSPTFGLLPGVAAADPSSNPPRSSESQAREAAYAPAEDCGECHQSIYNFWSKGPHARSASTPAYLESLTRVTEKEPGARKNCIWCHAPTTLVTGDEDLELPISREGITCDFCHTVAEVDMGKSGHPFVLDPGDIKRGPFDYAEITAHETAYSSLHRFSPLLCVACHEYTNTNGVAVLSTYTEWKQGPYPARGVPCQDCHMALVPGTMVREDLRKDSLRVVNLHQVVGGSARSQLDRGLDLKIESVERKGAMADVRVVVSNVAAGHMVPGGLATKSLVLAVGAEMDDGEIRYRQERIYRRELKDAQGRVLHSVADMFLRAASVGQDTRLKPRERRKERYSLTLPLNARAVIARLEYWDASDPRSKPKMTLVTEVRHDLTSR